MWGFALAGRPISLEQIGWLLTYAQIVFLAAGVAATMLAKRSAQPMAEWRITTNKWVGRAMALFGLFYAIAFALVAYHAP